MKTMIYSAPTHERQLISEKIRREKIMSATEFQDKLKTFISAKSVTAMWSEYILIYKINIYWTPPISQHYPRTSHWIFHFIISQINYFFFFLQINFYK